MRVIQAIFLMMSLLPVVLGAQVDFAHEVVPILKTHCGECHLGVKKKGGLSMNTREALLAGSESGEVLISGKAGESLLMKVIASHDPDIQMPPKGKRLGDSEIGVLKAWIDQGVPWEAGYSFKKPAYEPPLKPRRPELPVAAAGREHPVDRILDAYLAKQTLPTPAKLEDGTFLRRVHLDLWGLLPAPEKLEAFLADPAEDKRDRLVREMLMLNSSQVYAEHWMTFWNDLLRNDYAGTGYIDGGRKQISGWLYQALLANKPYDQFVRELVSPVEASEGFGRGIKWRGQVSAGQEVPVQFAQSMGQAFLGINLKCASCHDSFIDRWKLDEAYGMAAVFSAEPLEIHRCDKPTGRKAQPAWLFPELGQIDAALPPPERLKQLAQLMTHPENGRFTRTIVNRLWHRLMGHGIVHPVDAMQSEPWSSDLLDFLAVDLADHGYDLKHTMALICSSQAYQSVTELIKEGESGEYRYAGPRAKRMTAEQFADAVWQITGTAPSKIDAPIKRAGGGEMVRAGLLKSDLLMRSLGRPNREQIVSMRPNDLTTLEAMDLNNGQILTSRLENGAEAILKQKEGTNSASLIKWLYAYAYSRLPSPTERAVAQEALGETPGVSVLQDLLWAMLVQPEFQMVR